MLLTTRQQDTSGVPISIANTLFSQQQLKYLPTALLTILSFTIFHIIACSHLGSAKEIDLITIHSPPPFCFRILMPYLYAFLEHWFSPELTEILVEFVFNTGLYLVISAFFKPHTGVHFAHVATIVWMAYLTLLYGADPTMSKQNFFNAYDIPALFFMVCCLLSLRAKYYLALIICFILGTLTRESSILVVGIVMCQQSPPLLRLRVGTTLVVIYAAIRASFYFFHPQLPLFPFELINRLHHHRHVYENLWLIHQHHYAFMLLGQVGFLPLLWYLLKDDIPKDWVHVPYLLASYAIALLFVGRIKEGRIFEECLLLMYIPTVLALGNYIKNSVWRRDTMTS